MLSGLIPRSAAAQHMASGRDLEAALENVA